MNQKPDLPLSSPRTLLAIIAAMLGSLLLYALLFACVLHKPLSVGTIRDYFQIKLQRAAAIDGPKLVFFGGSNVRFGLRCELAEQLSGVPCVNAGFIADVGIDLMVAKFEPLLHAGDVVYVPPAYEQYLWSREFVATQRDAAYLFSYDRATLPKMSWYRQLHALFYFNLPYVVSSSAEMALAAVGLKRKAGASREFGAQNLNAWGDETGHSAAQAQGYAALLALKPRIPDAAHFDPQRHYFTQQLEAFLDWARAHGVTVVGGLPQMSEEIPIPLGVIDKVRAIYLDHGQHFVDLPSHSQYPHDCFFDSLYHLNEECQLRHTRLLMPLLQPYLPALKPAAG